MSTDWWIIGTNIAVAMGTLSLASAAWWTMRRDARENRRRIIMAVIDWVRDVIEPVEQEPPVFGHVPTPTQERFNRAVKEYGNCLSLIRQGSVIQHEAMSLKKDSLDEAIRSTANSLVEHARALGRLMLILDVFTPTMSQEAVDADSEAFGNNTLVFEAAGKVRSLATALL